MKYIDQIELAHKTILIRVDFNVSLNPNHSIADDARIKQSIPTLKHLLKSHNKLILMAHLGNPKTRSHDASLSPVAKRLHQYLPKHKIVLISDFQKDDSQIKNQKQDEIILLENIRFYPEEKANDPAFVKQLASYAEVYVNDGFSVSHRESASVVGIPKVLPSYGGLLLKKEVEMIGNIMKEPKHPFVAIIGGKKISTKIKVIKRLTEMADYVLLGGGLANTFIAAAGYSTGTSLISEEDKATAKNLLLHTKRANTKLVLPTDVVVGKSIHAKTSLVRKSKEIEKEEEALDVGPETLATFGSLIDRAKTIVWNGPVGFMENQEFKRGTDFLYYALAKNEDAISVVGGGDTLSAIAHKEYLEKITHISTGGGAMLEYIENGTLPGIEALK